MLGELEKRLTKFFLKKTQPHEVLRNKTKRTRIECDLISVSVIFE